MGYKIFSLVALILASSVATLCTAWGQVIGSGTVVVGLTPTETRTEKKAYNGRSDLKSSASSDIITSLMSELLPYYIQRGLERGLDRRVSIIDLSTNNPAGSNQAPSATVSPVVVNMGLFGVRISAKLSSRPDASNSSAAQVSAEEVLLLSPNADFGDLDGRLDEFGLRVAKRLTELSAASPESTNRRLPRGIVGFYCVSPSEFGDPQLIRLARMLTIELPYYFSQVSRKQGLELTVRGLDLKETSTCDLSSGIAGSVGERANSESPKDTRIENFSWTGTISRVPRDKSKIKLFIKVRDNSGGGNFRSLPPFTIEDWTNPAMPAIADHVVSNFSQEYEKSQFRIFLHFGKESLRKSIESKVRLALSDGGYNVVGSDPTDESINSSWIDYFFPEDCAGAMNIQQTLSEVLQRGMLPPIRKQPANNRPGTIGLWFSEKIAPASTPSNCQ